MSKHFSSLGSFRTRVQLENIDLEREMDKIMVLQIAIKCAEDMLLKNEIFIMNEVIDFVKNFIIKETWKEKKIYQSQQRWIDIIL